MLLTLYVVIDKIKIRDKFRKVHSKFSPEIMVISANFNDTSTMKTIARSIIAFIAILTCLFGPAAFGQQDRANVSTNASANAVHVNQRYIHGANSVVYYVVFHQDPETANKSPYSTEDMQAWGLRILDALDREFGDKIFKLKTSVNPTPAEQKRAKIDFLPRAEAAAKKWLNENELGDIILLGFDSDTFVATPTGKKGDRGRQGGSSLVIAR